MKTTPNYFRPSDLTLAQLRTEFNLLLMNLVVTELLMAAYGIPVDWLAAVRGEHLLIFIFTMVFGCLERF